MNRQFTIAILGSFALVPLVYAQVPALNLPGLPPPPGAEANLSDHDNAATQTPPQPPALNFDVTGPESIHANTKETPEGLLNPTDSIPTDLLDQMGFKDGEPGASEKNAGNNTSDSNDAPPKIAGSTEQSDNATDKTTTTDDSEIAAPVAANGPPPLALPAPNNAQVKNNTNPPPPAAVTSKRKRNKNTPRLPSGLANAAIAAAPSVSDSNHSGKSWNKKLAPARTYPKTRFNYRYVELPETVYQTRYDRFNKHLPTRRSQQDYDFELLRAAATNDVNGVRVLLKNGSNVNQINAAGDSALMIALKSGAVDAARLLVLKGANINHVGASGRTVFDYARRIADQDLLQALLKQSANEAS